MKYKNAFIVSFILFGIVSMINAEDYFPKNTFHDFLFSFYSSKLKALKEPSIYIQKSDIKKEIYRFTWLRSFHNPISIRVEIHDQDNAIIYIKETDIKGGFGPDKIKIDAIKTISTNSVKQVKKKFTYFKFWALSVTEESLGLDGAQWIVEGLSRGNYHIVERWSPKKGSIKEIGLHFLEISGLDVKEIY